MKIAVVGSGIAGNAAAWSLSKLHDVTIFEKDQRIGGHANTVAVNYNGHKITVDTGFIVFNEHNYPNFTALLEHLDVSASKTIMSFSVSLDDGRFEWRGNQVKGIFAQKRNIFSPGFLYMLGDILRFNRLAKKDLNSGALCGLTMRDYLDVKRFSSRMRDDYLIPMVASIWSTPTSRMLDFPAESLIRFMDNHRLMQIRRPKWRTVDNGSAHYVNRMVDTMRATIKTGCAVVNAHRTPMGPVLQLEDGSTERFDHVIFACHSDQTLAILSDADQTERQILANIPYSNNEVWLHRDPALMPRKRDAWASWNYIGNSKATPQQHVSVTYWMNRLQNIRSDCPLFISLNPHKRPDPNLVFERFIYAHPQFSAEALASQADLDHIQGRNGYSYCGAWTGYGFHEDGLLSGIQVAERLGGTYPWRQPMHPQAATQTQTLIAAE